MSDRQPLWEQLLRDAGEGKMPNAEQVIILTAEERELLEDLQADDNTGGAITLLNKLDEEKAWQQQYARITGGKGLLRPLPATRRMLGYAAAVMVPLLLIGGGFLYQRYGVKNDQAVSLATLPPTDHTKAVLVMEDGSRITLSDNPALKLTGSGNTQILKTDSATLQYSSQAKGATPEKAAYNRLIIPRGGEYKLVLADGTEVWLNAATTLQYPVHFEGTQTRDVYLEAGEAFFKVAKNASQPFSVHSADMDVQVLGTSFNINTYSADIKTTLVEGKVQVKSAVSILTLAPGEQSRFNKISKTINKTGVDIVPVIAWKDGWMIFDNDRLEDVMEMLGRWYDYDIRFNNTALKDVHFGGKLRRYQKVGDVLALIEKTGSVKFTVKNRTIQVNENLAP